MIRRRILKNVEISVLAENGIRKAGRCPRLYLEIRNVDLSFEATSDPQFLSALKHILETASQRSYSLPLSNGLNSRKFERYSYTFVRAV